MEAAGADAVKIEVPKPAKAPKEPKAGGGRRKKGEGVVTGYRKSQEGRRMINTVARSIFGMLKKK